MRVCEFGSFRFRGILKGYMRISRGCGFEISGFGASVLLNLGLGIWDFSELLC